MSRSDPNSERQTLEEFIEEQGLIADVEAVDSNPNMGDMPAGSRHYVVTIRKGNKSYGVPFSQGPAIERKPALIDVLDCLATDAATLDDSFDEWADELGFFPMESSADYQRAWRTFEAVQEQSAGLRRLLGDDAFETLLWETERG